MRERLARLAVEESDEDAAAGCQHATELGEDLGQVRRRRVDQRIPGEDAADGTAVERQVAERPEIEGDIGVPCPRGRDELGRQVDSPRLAPARAEELGPVPGSASGIEQPSRGCLLYTSPSPRD